MVHISRWIFDDFLTNSDGYGFGQFSNINYEGKVKYRLTFNYLLLQTLMKAYN